MPELNKFYLVGGTALSLQYGHRTSVDLDLFCTEQFEHKLILSALEENFGENFGYEGDHPKFGIFCFIEKIKADIVHYPHPIISDFVTEEGVRMYSSKDIAAMKIQAILGRGKKKDFWDIAELLKNFSVEEIIQFHKQKFPSQQLLISIPQALAYFEDAEESETPISLKKQTWEKIKSFIRKKVSDYLK